MALPLTRPLYPVVCALRAGNRPGIALQAGQLQPVSERRFEQALAFDGCFVYLDAQYTLVIWHALPATHSTLDRILSRML